MVVEHGSIEVGFVPSSHPGYWYWFEVVLKGCVGGARKGPYGSNGHSDRAELS
jgi:hypothetical protein